MVKLKDVIWGEVNLVDESLLVYDSNADTSGKGETIVMCCGGGGHNTGGPAGMISTFCSRP